MTILAPQAPATGLGFFGKLRAFTDNIFQLPLHILFAGFWSLSLLGNLHAVSGQRWVLHPSALILVGTVFLCLLSLRMVDEIKDFDYDLQFNPDRPLVTGLVTRQDIRRFLILIAILVLSLNSMLSAILGLVVALDLLYGLCQLPLEKHLALVRENMFVNLAVVYPVNIGLSVYTLAFFLQARHSAPTAQQVLLVGAYALAFLHFEIARKSGWPHLAQAGERLYSQIIGLPAACLLSSALGCACLGLVLWLFAPWSQTGASAVTGYLPLLALLPMVWGLLRQFRARHQRAAARPPAVAFLFTFYFTMLAHAIASNAIEFEWIMPWKL